MPLPSLLKAEVKVTTGAHIVVAARELAALDVGGADGAAGVVCGMFVGGAPETDGQWILVDARPLLGRAADTVAVSRTRIVGLARSQPSLGRLRCHVKEVWPVFFDAWKDTADRGHRTLLSELEQARRGGSLAAPSPRHEVLEVEHRRAIADFVARHGEHDAGRLLQDMLGYAIALGGYGRITNNPIGVPDFVLERLDDRRAGAVVSLAEHEARELLELCERTGEVALAMRLRERLAYGSGARRTRL